MKRIVRWVTLITLVGGWALALSAVHIVRTPGQLPVVGGMLPSDWGTVHVFTKSALGFRQTLADTRGWTPDDAAAHPIVTERLIAVGFADAVPATTQPSVKGTTVTITAHEMTVPEGIVKVGPTTRISSR